MPLLVSITYPLLVALALSRVLLLPSTLLHQASDAYVRLVRIDQAAAAALELAGLRAMCMQGDIATGCAGSQEHCAGMGTRAAEAAAGPGPAAPAVARLLSEGFVVPANLLAVFRRAVVAVADLTLILAVYQPMEDLQAMLADVFGDEEQEQVQGHAQGLEQGQEQGQVQREEDMCQPQEHSQTQQAQGEGQGQLEGQGVARKER